MAGKTIEVDETQFLANSEVVKTVEAMMKNPEARKLVLKAQKTVYPNAVIPELDAAKPIEDAVSAIRQEFADYRKAEDERREKQQADDRLKMLRTSFENGRAKLRADGYTDEGLAEVEKLMEAKGLMDHEDARIIFERLHPPSAPATPAGFGGWNFFEAEKGSEDMMKKLLESKGEDEGVIRQITAETLAELRGPQGRR